MHPRAECRFLLYTGIFFRDREGRARIRAARIIIALGARTSFSCISISSSESYRCTQLACSCRSIVMQVLRFLRTRHTSRDDAREQLVGVMLREIIYTMALELTYRRPAQLLPSNPPFQPTRSRPHSRHCRHRRMRPCPRNVRPLPAHHHRHHRSHRRTS